MSRVVKCLVLLAVLALAAVPAFAQVPRTMSYQGVLTDASGVPVPDGLYDLTFRIYNVPSAGTALWTEARTGVNHVQVSRGGFSVNLGTLVPLSIPFDGQLYLGIQVAADPELSPRVALASAPYAMGLRLPFTLGSTAGLPMLNAYDYGGLGAAFDFTAPGGSSIYGLEPDGNGSGGFFWVSKSIGNGFTIDGNSAGTGDPTLSLTGSASSVLMNTNASGDAAVQLPANSISAGEILDEPGVAQGHVTGSVNVPVSGTMGDIVTVTLTTPAAGYVVVEADGQHGFAGSGTATYNYADYQIDETAGGGVDSGHYFVSGFSGPAGGFNTFQWAPVSVRRTYYKSVPGSYTFRLEANASQSEALSNYFWNPTISATFYPTGYGGVTTAPPAAELSQFQNVQPTAAVANGPGHPGAPSALVDLRELEVRAAQAAAASERAQRQLIEARAQDQARLRAAAAPPVSK